MGVFNIRVYWLIKTRSGNAGKYHCTLVARHKRPLQKPAESHPPQAEALSIFA